MATLARRTAKIALFIFLFCLSARFIDPATFLSLDTSENFALWKDGIVSQENYDDLLVLTWVACSFISAIVGCIVILKLIKKVRSK